MPRSKAAVNELGTIYTHGEAFCAHIQFRADDGNQVNIRGPSRATEGEAQKDLDQIRAAGGVGATREEGLKIMEAEARRIKISAEYQSEIQQTIERMASQEIADESAMMNGVMTLCPNGCKSIHRKKIHLKSPHSQRGLY